jgi:hypothetical protein
MEMLSFWGSTRPEAATQRAYLVIAGVLGGAAGSTGFCHVST